MKESREDRWGRRLHNTGSRSRPRIAVEHLEPRFLLSLTAVDQPIPHDAPTADALRIVEVGPIGASDKLDTTADAGTATASTEAAPGIPSIQADQSASLAVEDGRMAPADNSATYQLPGGATSFLVTLRILSPETQASWTLFVRDGLGREVGSVSVPRGQGGVAFAIVSPSRVATGPITLTVSADLDRAGRSSRAYDLEVAAAVLANTDPPAPAPAPAAADDTAFFFISTSANANGNMTLDEGPAYRPHASPSPGALSAGAASSAPPSGSIEPAYPKPTSGGGVPRALIEELPSEEQAEAAADSEPPEHDAAVAQGDSPEMSDLACSARQAVDAPGGLPEEATAGRRGVRARRLAEEGALRHPGTRSGTVVVSAIVAAGLIVPNVLILGAPRFRPSRLRWRRAPQRRTSPSAED